MMLNDIRSLLPGFNCGICGKKNCGAFAEALLDDPGILDKCQPLKQERFQENRKKLLTDVFRKSEKKEDRGILDQYLCDFRLYPLPNEHSCREILHPLTLKRELKTGDVIRYRPLGCPVVHFATVVEIEEGLYKASITGPCHRIGKPQEFIDAGVCMILGFEGRLKGTSPGIGKTVRFIPDDCMMQKVHSGVVVQQNGTFIRIEIIDLKVWALPE